MKDVLRRILIATVLDLAVGGGGYAYMQIFQPGNMTGTDCLFIFMFLSIFVLTVYVLCCLQCPTDETPLNVPCQQRCLTFFWIGQFASLGILFACIAGIHIW